MTTSGTVSDLIRAELTHCAWGKLAPLVHSLGHTRTSPDLSRSVLVILPKVLAHSTQVIPGYWKDNELKSHCSWVPGNPMGRYTHSWPLTSWDSFDLNSVIPRVIWHLVSLPWELLEWRIRSQITESCIKCTLDCSVHMALETALLPAWSASLLCTLGCSSWNLPTRCLTLGLHAFLPVSLRASWASSQRVTSR